MRFQVHFVASMVAACTISIVHSQSREFFPPQRNANHIFNAILSSMRQWGSTLNHNGMSFFIATVPAATQLYHGRPGSKPIDDMDWLAFEPEHAAVFARLFPLMPKNPGWTPGSQPPPETVWRHPWGPEQSPLHQTNEGSSSTTGPGWLHTYVTKKDLRLLYIDGMAAAKSAKGTLDSQDYILLNQSERDHGIPSDLERARRICAIAGEEWSGRIDGVIRMEAGFEIILCSPEDSLKVVRITRAKAGNTTGPGPIPGIAWDYDDAFAYLRAVAARYHGIGEGRVVLDYGAFITAYSYPFDLFHSQTLPRLQNLSADALSIIRRDLYDLVMGEDRFLETPDWQKVADMIVKRYASQLQYLASGKLPTSTLLSEQIDRILSPFIL